MTYTLECQDCYSFISGTDSLDAQNKADSAGWVSFDDGWVCPSCAASRRKEVASG